MRVKNRLKSYRHKYEMNQTEFAAFLGISSDQYNRYEKYGQGLAEPDSFCIWRGSPFFFVEVQRSEYTTKQIAKKVARYESLYHSRSIESEPWQPKGRTVFPAVLMITEKRYPIESKAVRFVQVAELGELF